MSRRSGWSSAIGALVVACVVLAGCSSSPGSAESPGPPPAAGPTVPPPAPGTTDGRFPVTIVHGFGETVVPAAPRRIVADGDTDLDAMLALGVHPAATTRIPPLPPWTRARLGPTPPVLVFQVPDVFGFVYDYDRHQLGGVDLISSASRAIPRAQYDADSGIAPTVTPPTSDPAAPTPWQDVTRLVAQAVGRPVEAERVIADVEGRLASAPSRYPQLGGRSGVCVLRDYRKSSNGGFGVDGSCQRLLTRLGMRGVPELTATDPTQPFPLTPQQIAAARPDVVVLTDSSDGTLNAQLFPPGQRIVDLDSDEVTALQYPSALAIPALLSSAPPKLVRALQ